MLLEQRRVRNLPKTPALLPTNVPRRVILLRTAFRRTLKAGDLTAAVALASVLFADEAAAVEACCAAAAAVDWDAAAAEAVLRDEEVDAAAACAAWFRVLFKVGFVPSRFDRTIPSLKPHRPPAMRPEAWVDAQVRMLLCLLNANKIP